MTNLEAVVEHFTCELSTAITIIALAMPVSALVRNQQQK